MTLEEARKIIAEKNREIRLLRDLKNDLLFYGNVLLCKECTKYDKGNCSHWKTEVKKDGYCNYGERR